MHVQLQPLTEFPRTDTAWLLQFVSVQLRGQPSVTFSWFNEHCSHPVAALN
jgi:hypothetical protein